MLNDVPWCTMMYNDVQWCAMMYNDVQWCTMMYNDVQLRQAHGMNSVFIFFHCSLSLLPEMALGHSTHQGLDQSSAGLKASALFAAWQRDQHVKKLKNLLVETQTMRTFYLLGQRLKSFQRHHLQFVSVHVILIWVPVCFKSTYTFYITVCLFQVSALHTHSL